MALRIRSVKPEFFNDEEFATLSIWARHIYVGLWLAADRDGKLEDRPKKLKTQVMPYDDVDMDALIEELTSFGCLVRYEVGGVKVIKVKQFLRHQKPGRDEPPSELPDPDGGFAMAARPPNETVRQRIYDRDRCRCLYCGEDMTANSRRRCVDHVVPISRGGSHEENNLVCACKRCGERKRDRTPTEAGMPWPEPYGLEETGEITRLRDAKGTLQPQLIETPSYDGDTPVIPPLTGGLTGVVGSVTLEEWELEKEREKEREELVVSPQGASAANGPPTVLPNGIPEPDPDADPDSPAAVAARRMRMRRQLEDSRRT